LGGLIYGLNAWERERPVGLERIKRIDPKFDMGGEVGGQTYI